MVLARKGLLLPLCWTLIALLSLAACGGDDDDDANGGNGTHATRAEDGSPTENNGDDGEATATEDGGDSEAPVEVCALLTTEEVSAATEADMETGVPDNSPPYFGCDWEDELGLHSATLEILAASDEANVAYFEETGDAEPIDGLGDRAQYTDLIGLEILTDHYVVSVRLFAFDLEDDVVQERSLALGELALGRLND